MLHVPVMPAEVLHWLDPRPGAVAVDATLGAGGHAALLLERLGPSGRLIALDQDPAMLREAQLRFAGQPITLVHRNFEDLRLVLDELGIARVDLLLADVGFCSDQLADPARGFSFQADGPLDMRLDPTGGQTAAQLLRQLPERELADLFWRFGEERFSRRVARRIVETRKAAPLETTAQLADLVRSCVPRGKGHSIDPATRVFQALRIAVNDELGALERLLQAAPNCLRPGGRMAVLSFHSLEDRLVKQAFRKTGDLFTPLTPKPVLAGDAETQHNPRARSAKLRVAELRGKANLDQS